MTNELFNDYDFLEGLNLLTGNELKVYMALMWDHIITHEDIHMDRKTFKNAYEHLYKLGFFTRHWKTYLADVQIARIEQRKEELQTNGLVSTGCGAGNGNSGNSCNNNCN